MVKKKPYTSDLSQKRRKKRGQKPKIFIYAFAFILIGLCFLVRASWWQIRGVAISNIQTVSSQQITKIVDKNISGNYFYIFPKNNILFYPEKEIESELLASYPQLSSVNLKVRFDGMLGIDGQEKIGAYLWCSVSNDCYNMDYSGFIFEKAQINVAHSRTFRGLITGVPIGQHFGSPDFVETIDAFLKKVETLGISVPNVKVVDKLFLEGGTEDGMILQFNSQDIKENDLFAYLKTFIENLKKTNGGVLPPLEYIDARYGNKIFYKLKNS